MKTKCFAKWMLALKSNKFKQARGYLHRDNTYCALGVLCELSKLGTWKPDPYIEGVFYYDIEGDKTSRSIRLPPSQVLEEWAGMEREQAGLLSSFVANLNDRKHSFAEIATTLEKMYKKRPAK